MTTTAPRVTFGLFNLQLREDATLSTASDLQTFSDIDDLRTGNINGRPYATYEPDFWLLDGTYKFMPVAPAVVHVGMMSLDMSDGDGVFTVPPVLTVDFSAPQGTESLSLMFSPATGDYCSSIQVEYYNGAELVQDDTYAPADTEFSTDQSVPQFTQIVITFLETNRPYRYLRVMGIDYGRLIVFESDDIQGATVIEEVDPLSAKLQFNTMELRLYSEDAQFSLINPAGDWAVLTQRQPLNVYEIVDGARVFIGQYYLSDWENLSDRQIQFRCVDLVGLMDSIPYRGGLWTGTGEAVQDVLASILGAASIPYELDDTLYDTMIIGWIPAGTLREGLQQIAFAIGAVVDCSRSWAVRIYPAPLAVVVDSVAIITRSEQGIGPRLSLKPVIGGVEVTAHSYTEGIEERVLLEETLIEGLHEVIFDSPMHTLSITGATISESGANYAILSVAAEGAVTLSGYTYNDATQAVTINNPDLASAIRPVLRIADATLIHPATVTATAQRVYDYYQLRLVLRPRLFAPLVGVGQTVQVDTLHDSQLCGIIEKLEIDLAKGMLARADIVGARVVS